MSGTETTGRRPPSRPRRDPGPGTSRPVWVRALRGLAWLVGAGLLAAAVGVHIGYALGGEGRLLIVLLAALAGWALPAALGAAVLFALARHRISAALAVVTVLVALLVLTPFPHGNGQVPEPDVAGGRAVELTVLSQNALFGQVPAQEVLTAVRREQPDVLVVTELTRALAAQLSEAGLRELMPHTYLEPGYAADGTGIWSVHPLGQGEPVLGMAFSGLDVPVRLPGGTVRVLGVHPTPPLTDTWDQDFDRLATHLASVRERPEPFVVAGDLNADRFNGPLRRLLADGLSDVASTRLWAWQQQTWPVDPQAPAGRRDWAWPALPMPLIRIDHVLVPEDTEVLQVRTVRMRGSDHLGVLARVRLVR